MTDGDATVGLEGRGRGRFADPAFRWIVLAAGLGVLLVLGLMMAFTTVRAWPVFAKEGFHFFTSSTWDPGTSRSAVTGTYGAFAFIYGTLVTSAIAVVLAVPLSVAVALWLTDVAPSRLGGPVAYAVDLLAAVPSVVYGLWGVFFFVPTVLQPVMDRLSSTLGRYVFLFKGPVYGLSYFSAGVVLAIMILPIVTAITREVFATVPAAEREAAYGLGATRWEVMRHVVLFRGRAGLIGATMLGLGRALGETIAVALLVGSAEQVSSSLFAPGYSMAAVIANTFQESTPEGITGLLAVGVALFVITLLVNVVARLVVARIGVAPEANL